MGSLIIFMEVMMNQNNLTNDESVKTQNADIPIHIDSELTDALAPNSYLVSLGITREKRETHIKQLAKAVINPDVMPDNFHAQIPFMITKGPFINEDFLTISLKRKERDGKAFITLGLVKEPEEVDGIPYL